MHAGDWYGDLVREKIAREHAAAEERRLARLATHGNTLRARIARKLFEMAVAVEKEETWRAVWEKLEAPVELPANRG